MKPEIQEILELYAQGCFLMDNGSGLLWYRSPRHALIPLDQRFHTPRSLRRALNNPAFETRIDCDFSAVVRGCADRGGQGGETWISPALMRIYTRLYQHGYAHSFEIWSNNQLAGGIFGIGLGGAFIGESMFFRVPQASKVALVRLVEHLRQQGYLLFDAQVQNPHLERFGAYELDEQQFLPLLGQALNLRRQFV